MARPTNYRVTVAACLLALTAGLPAIAQDDEEAPFDRTPQDCILASNIDKHDAVDDQNILFYMRNRVYRNHLPRTCPGLERNNRISYKLQGTRRLCSTDVITVLEDSFGFGGAPFRDGFTCRLGEFVPLSPEEVEDLERRDDEGRDGRQTQSTIETSEVELPDRDEASGEPEPAESAPAADESDD
jgi:hypothetical protein